MASVVPPPFKSVQREITCICGEKCASEIQVTVNELEILQCWIEPNVRCHSCDQHLSDVALSYTHDLRDSFLAPENYWREKGDAAKQSLSAGLDGELRVELRQHLDELNSDLHLRFARQLDSSATSALRAISAAAEQDRFAIFDSRYKLWRDELCLLQNEEIKALAATWAAYDVALSYREWVGSAVSSFWTPLAMAPLRWIVETLGLSGDATMWIAPIWLYGANLAALRANAVDEWQSTQHLLAVLRENVNRKLAVDREASLNKEKGTLRLEARLGNRGSLAKRLASDSAHFPRRKSKPVREGERVARLFEELEKLRTLYRDNALTKKELLQQTSDFIVWEWVERLPDDRKSAFLNFAEWDDNADFLYRQIATLYEHASPLSRKRSYATIKNWRKAFLEYLRNAGEPKASS